MPADKNISDEQAMAALKKMRWQASTLFRALDTDGDGVLSAQEIAAAPIVLKQLVTRDDGCLSDDDIGGPTLIPGLVRRSGIVRLLDEDGDLIIGPDDIAQAAERIRLLDTDGDGRVTAEDDLPPPGANAEMRMPMGSPAQVLAFQTRLFTRAAGISGPLPPSGRTDVQPGYLLIQEVNDRADVQKSNRTFLMDEGGEIVQRWHTGNRLPEATVSYLLADGHLLRTSCRYGWLDTDGQFPIGANGTITIEDKQSHVVWEWTRYEMGSEALHHDIEMMPNGNILAICWSRLSASKARGMGWVQQGSREFIVLDKIFELKPDLKTGATEIVWQWAMHDHMIQNVDPAAPNFGSPADHPEKIDINWPQLDNVQFNSNQLAHMNSVSYNAREDIILLSSAVFGELWIIDHSTTREQAADSSGGRYGRGGDLIWRWGNPQTHDNGTAQEQLLYWQHDAHFVPDGVPRQGDVMVFNNGMRRDADGNPDVDQICMGMVSGAWSEVIELVLPRDDSGMISAGQQPEIVWNFNRDGAVDFYSPFMSGARRMPNGNTLMAQACDKRIVEITPAGDVVMDFHVGGPGRLFRINKYAPNHPGIMALAL